MIRAILVDDEPAARDELAALLAAAADVEVVAACPNAIEALGALRRERADVLFLDVQMPVVNGFELLGMIPDELAPMIVFVTAHDAFALRAFEENAVDYLLKPVAPERLARALERVRARAVSARPAVPAPPLTRVPCLSGKAVKLVPLSDVEYVHSSAAGVYVVTAQGEFFTDLTLRTLEERSGLFRCHKQHLVNLERVDEICPGEDPAAVIRTRSGREVAVGRRFVSELRSRLGL